MAHTWIIAVDPQISNLVELGRNFGDSLTAIVVGDAKVAGVDRVIRIQTDAPAEAAGPAVAGALELEAGDLVLAANKPAERVLAGAVAAAKKLPVLYGLKSVAAGEATLSRFGGIALETVSITDGAVAVVDGGIEVEGEAPAEQTASGDILDAQVAGIETADVATVNLVAAKRIVAAGRGFKAKEDLKLAEDLAGALEAEVACSRPLAEGTEWLPRDRYIGISGQQVAPNVYVALGISGQIQHTAGMSDSGTVIAVNTDDKAPIFAQADYGVVGDLYTVVPAIIDALK
ncbi:electron transfer flavoprotein subunit alpha/FixB family protein [Arcanobacterium haemolyticum]|nr:electron transfer flavoprotein subunit alpha/FixB family protein [Arcanobacterium haemolyticum]